MAPDSLTDQIEAFVDWDLDPEAAIPIARSIPTGQLAEFFGQARTRLDDLAKQWARGQADVPHWIGAAHPRAPYELRRKTEILEMEWRARHS